MSSSRERASASEWSSWIPASSRTICPIAQKVIPSPYERQAPRTTRARDPTRCSSSEESRDLPTPGSPTTVTSRQRRSPAAASNSSARPASSLSRPMSGVPFRREVGPTPATSSSR